MNSKTCIFFDVDGTLLDVKERYHAAHKESCEKLSISPLPLDIYWEYKKNKIPESKILKLDSELFKKYNEQRVSNLEDENFLLLDKVFHGVPKLLERLNKKGFYLYIVTVRKNKQRVIDQIKRLNLDPYFIQILSTPASTNPEKDKVNLIKTIKKINFNSIHWMIGDTEADILCGKELNFKTIAVTSGIRTEKFLKKYKPDFLINNIIEIQNNKIFDL